MKLLRKQKLTESFQLCSADNFTVDVPNYNGGFFARMMECQTTHGKLDHGIVLELEPGDYGFEHGGQLVGFVKSNPKPAEPLNVTLRTLVNRLDQQTKDELIRILRYG